MELELTNDQQLFRETTRKFLETSTPLTVVRQLAAENPDGFDRGWWRRGAELGWTSMLVPEDQGGGSVSGEGVMDLQLIAEEMGRLVSPGPLLPTNIVAAALSAPDAGGHHEGVVAGLLSGETIATWAVVEPGGSWSPSEAQLRAEPSGDGFVLHGDKTAVEAAAQADYFLVAARTGGGLTQFLVPADTPGISVTALESLDMVRRFGRVHFDTVEVPSSALVGEVGGAASEIERLLQFALIVQCAEMVGAIDQVFSFTLEYSFDRFSFGRALASYQALKHRFADMKLWLEASHATSGAAARAVQAGTDDAPELVSVAKSYIGDRGPALLQDCVQMHGGIGVTWDHDLHLYIRRVTQDRVLFGAPSDHRERIATLIGL
ncbi:MAG TPA: acyl-CoA dehydrogenase family protein [Acidimicrobiales bacterium]|nr:acyl-CoA dehydrogenase family protein [Acidimicrobiales bacterium]